MNFLKLTISSDVWTTLLKEKPIWSAKVLICIDEEAIATTNPNFKVPLAASLEDHSKTKAIHEKEMM